MFSASSYSGLGTKDSNLLQIPSIANLLTPDPYKSGPDIKVSQAQPGFKFPSSIDKFKSADAKLLISDPYPGIRGADKIDDVGDEIDVYYEEGNIDYSDYYYYDERKDDYYNDQFINAWNKDREPQESFASSSVAEDGLIKFEMNEKAQVGKSEPQRSPTAGDDPDYSPGPRLANIVYSVPYSKTKIINKQPVDEIYATSVSDTSQNFEDVFTAEDSKSGKHQNTTQPSSGSSVNIIEHKPSVIIEDQGGERVMLVTPMSISSNEMDAPFDVLTDKLTLEDIHNFTYEGWRVRLTRQERKKW